MQKSLLFQICFLILAAWAFILLVRPESGSANIQYSSKAVDFSGVLSVNNQDKVYPGYLLLPVNGTEKVFLLDTMGNPVHHWNVDADRARLLPNCNLLVVHGSKWGMRNEPWKSMRSVIREYNWEGKSVWEFTAPDIVHHDIQRLENGNTIFPVRSIIAGNYKNLILDDAKKALEIRSDSIYEITNSGEIVWQWDAHDHLDLNSCGRRKCKNYAGKANAKDQLSDWTHINTTTIIPANKWYDSGDKRFKPGNILILPRNWWMAFIIDKDTKEVVWEYGGEYKGGLSGGHEAHMIPKAYPGAGNILIFDNGRSVHNNESFVLEINPVTNKLVWVYDKGPEFFSNSSGSAQRLKNGNTLISEDVGNRVFEVTPAKETVWELKNDLRISRAKKYPKNYCPALVGL